MRQALNEAWGWVAGSPVLPDRFRDLDAKCQAVIPDTEDFSTLLCSQALDAGVAVCETLQLAMGADLGHAVNAASVARDTVDMFIQERDQMDYADPEFEKKILEDPLMIGELSAQRSVLMELSSHRDLEPKFVEALRTRFRGQSNIR